MDAVFYGRILLIDHTLYLYSYKCSHQDLWPVHAYHIASLIVSFNYGNQTASRRICRCIYVISYMVSPHCKLMLLFLLIPISIRRCFFPTDDQIAAVALCAKREKQQISARYSSEDLYRPALLWEANQV